MKILFVSLFLFSPLALAEVEENYCIDQASTIENEQLLKNNPNDPIVVKLVALRQGLCDLVDKGLVDLEFAIDLFDREKNQAVMQRIMEEQTQTRGMGS